MGAELKPEHPPGEEEPAEIWREAFGGPWRPKRWHAILAVITAPMTGIAWIGGETRWRDFFIGLGILASLVVALLAVLWFAG